MARTVTQQCADLWHGLYRNNAQTYGTDCTATMRIPVQGLTPWLNRRDMAKIVERRAEREADQTV